MRRITRAFKVIVVVVAMVFALEVLLRAFDPWGAVYYDNVQQLWAAVAPDPSGYTFREGVWPFGNSTFTILPDGTRAVPGSVDGGPRITFVGDSVTFAQGVDDGDTWISLVCDRLALECVNMGRSSYNIENIAALAETVEGCAVWLTIENDPAGRQGLPHARKLYAPYTLRYLAFALTGRAHPSAALPITDQTAPLFRSVIERPDTLTLAFVGEYGETMLGRYGVTLIPNPTSGLSRIDGHADAQGNRQIAAAVAPILSDWLHGREC